MLQYQCHNYAYRYSDTVKFVATACAGLKNLSVTTARVNWNCNHVRNGTTCKEKGKFTTNSVSSATVKLIFLIEFDQ